VKQEFVMAMKFIKLQLMVPEEEAKKLKDAARYSGVFLSAYIMNALRLHFGWPEIYPGNGEKSSNNLGAARSQPAPVEPEIDPDDPKYQELSADLADLFKPQ
jgi:hypothetical protein